MKRMRTAAVALIAATASFLLLLTGCAAIPTSGAVLNSNVQDDTQTTNLRYYPASPVPGASREEVVQGFIDAGTGLQNNFAVARQFLTVAEASHWQPGKRVLITDGQVSMRSPGQSRVTVNVSVTGEIDEHGVYTERVSGKPTTLSFELTEENGQWRISEAPDGIVLLRQPFTDLFRATPLTFYDVQRRYLTTDLRWFPRDSDIIGRTVSELLAGPAQWLYPGAAVTSAFPPQTRLLSPVTVSGGEATVNLSNEASASAEAGDLSLMRLQLEQTLGGFTEVTSVSMRVNNARIDAAAPTDSEVVRRPDVNSLPLVYQQGHLGYLGTDSLIRPAGADRVDAVAGELQPLRGALSASRKTATLLTERGTYVLRYGDAEATLVDSRGGQVEPALDNWDWVWTQSTTQNGLYVSQIGGGTMFELPLPTGVARNFTSHQVSRDGTKLAVLFTTREGVTLAIMPILRKGGEPDALGDPLLVPMPTAEETANDVAWVDGNSVAMLVNNSSGSTEVRLYRVGGELTSLGTIPNAMQVAGANTLAGMRVVDKQGVVYAPRGTRWQASTATVNFLFAQM